ncbi:MAG: hemolysin family protein [Pedobacter sp.]|uniref:hemolysin family protein n=1 Tax=Pedobacter sp. TaxID=1411316 RepID=UPI00280669CC|nr:hemolysin family protein [Pedobacter sp.]MDQ8004100.1 hemolysin family protein [Pedobacter sp.]
MEILIIFVLVLLNGIFAMSELSLVSSRRYKLENAAKKGNSGAKTALELSDNPTRFLSTVQIGITLIGILLGVYSGESITKNIAQYVAEIEMLAPYASQIGTALSVIFITYLSIVLGELFPKRVGLTFPEPVAILVSRPMLILSKITSPFVWLLTTSNNILLKVFGIKATSDSRVTEEEIKAIVKDSAAGGEIQEIEQHIVERVFELGDKKVSALYTHRSDLIYFNEDDDFETVRKKINEDKHSAYPVCSKNNLDHIKGLVLLKDLFDDANQPFSLTRILRQPLFITENRSAYQVIEHFKKEKMHYAIVINEYGTTAGMVTMDDVLDALIGDVTQHYQKEYAITQRDENSWLVDGYYNLGEFQKFFALDIDPEAGRQYTTVSGLIIYHLQRIPEVGDKLTIDTLTLEVVDKDGQRIDKIMVTKD